MMRNPWEEVPLSPHRHLNALTSEAPGQESLDWKDVWYRLDDGRGRINLSDLENRVSRTTNNTQAIAQALSLLGRADVKKSGFVEYAQFKDFYNTTLPATSWERAVLARVALDVNDLTISFDEEAVYSAWVELVNYMHTTPSNLDFNWLWLLPSDYDRTRLPHSVYYKSDLVHPWRLREWLLRTKAADDLPNITVIKLLEKCEDSLQEADANRDGYIEYKEFLRFVTTTTTAYRGSTVLRRGALGVLPRSERTLAKRRYLEECSCCPPPLFMLLITVAEITTFIYYVIDMQEPIQGNEPAPTYSPLVFNPRRRYEAWRYVSYPLIHSGWVHLVNNLAVQMVLGVLLELVHTWRVAVIYLAGVVAGSLAHSLYTPTFILCGASGGVYAVEYAHLGNLLMNWSEMEVPWIQLTVILVVMSLDLGYAVWDTTTNPNTSTGHMAHLAGAMAGLLVGVVVLRNLHKERWETYCWWTSLVLFLVLVTSGVLLNVFLPIPEFFPENDWSPISKNREDWMWQHEL
ncbi:rhomboid-related protein 1 isoform X1 [Procambarus clarkii]|uniref:rhomboid-related protein 1 isoform X1 n=1 Tax=Procambarus clarkii TaxID=6728 RepID=UPI003741FB5C